MDFELPRFLVASPLLAGLDPAARAEAARAFVPRPYGDGEPLVTAATDPPGLIVLVDGAAEVWVRHGGRRARIAVLGAGDFAGEGALFAPDVPRVTDVIGAGTGMAALLPVATWRQLLADDHPVTRAIEVAVVRSLCFRLQYRMEHALGALARASVRDLAARARELQEEP